jgi:hypothetical protein
MFKTFEDLIANITIQQRQSHKDLTSPCCFTSKKGKEYTSKRRSQDAARENIVEFLIEQGILDPVLANEKFGKNGLVQCNHLCSAHGGKDGPVCNNPKHLYIGSQKENWEDVSPDTGLSAKESAVITKNTEEGKERASLSQKISWQERKARLLQTDK